jgi:hypothetical protein
VDFSTWWTDVQEFFVLLAPLVLVVSGAVLATLLSLSAMTVFVNLFARLLDRG